MHVKTKITLQLKIDFQLSNKAGIPFSYKKIDKNVIYPQAPSGVSHF